MDSFRAIAAGVFALGLASCAELDRQGGLSGAAQDYAFPAASKKMALLRAEIAMMYLSFVAVDSSGRAASESISAVAAINRVALDIDCIRSSAATGERPALPTAAAKPPATTGTPLCPNLEGLYFFDTRMVSVERDLVALAKASLPNEALSKLLASLPTATNQPLALIAPILAAARDALLISQRGLAVYRDGVEIEIDVFCGPDAVSAGLKDEDLKACKSVRNEIDNGRNVKEQRRIVIDVLANAPGRYSVVPKEGYFRAARILTAINCERLKVRIDTITDTISCNVRSPSGPLTQ